MRTLRITVLAVVGCGIAGAAHADLDGLAGRLDRVLAKPALAGAAVSVLVVDRDTGEALYARSPDRALIPASTQKLVTAVAALEQLGPAHRFTTELYASAPPDADGAIDDLYLRGGGDPLLTSELWWRLAADLRAEGVRHVRGAILLDDTRYDTVRWHPSWAPITERAYHAPVGALNANYGAFRVVVAPGAAPGEPIRATLDPPVTTLELVNRATTVARRGPALQVRRRALADREQVIVSGTLPHFQDASSVYRSVADPARYAGAMLAMQLGALGVPVDGGIRRAATPEGATLLLAFDGDPLATIVRRFLKYSNNAVAETLVKELGFRSRGVGAWDGGASAMRTVLGALGIPAGEAQWVDGSGLSRSNRLSARVLVDVLRRADRSFRFGPEVLTALPIAGADGTLRKRAQGALGRVRGKTGTLDGVTTLAGVAETAHGRALTFAILVNGRKERDLGMISAVDAFAAALVEAPLAPVGAVQP